MRRTSVLIAAAVVLSACTARKPVEVTVLDGESGAAVPGANVGLEYRGYFVIAQTAAPAASRTQTDAAGRAHVTSAPLWPEPGVLHVSADGYQHQVLYVDGWHDRVAVKLLRERPPASP